MKILYSRSIVSNDNELINLMRSDQQPLNTMTFHWWLCSGSLKLSVFLTSCPLSTADFKTFLMNGANFSTSTLYWAAMNFLMFWTVDPRSCFSIMTALKTICRSGGWFFCTFGFFVFGLRGSGRLPGADDWLWVSGSQLDDAWELSSWSAALFLPRAVCFVRVIAILLNKKWTTSSFECRMKTANRKENALSNFGCHWKRSLSYNAAQKILSQWKMWFRVSSNQIQGQS